MNRLVYLFELDPAKDSRKDAEAAEFAIFNEIIKNGNKVVLSVNQFVDSRVMASAVCDEENYKHVRRLFDEGAIKVSLFADVCSVSQYVQIAIERCLSKGHDGYVFKTLPVRADDAEMLKDIHAALKYSDLTNINARLDEEYLKLREEDDSDKRSDILESIKKIKITLRFLSLVLRLSGNTKSSNPAKPSEGRSFIDFLTAARAILKTESFRRREINALKERILDRLNGALCHFAKEGLPEKKINRRTTWLKYLKAGNRADSVNEYAIEIVNLCYNYAVQDTIYGVSKQFDDKKFEDTFRYDFIRRVNLIWKKRNRPVSPTTPLENSDYRLFYPRQWKRAAAISTYNSESQTVSTVDPDGNPAERKNWYSLIFKKFGVTLGFTAAYIAVFCVIGLLMGFIGAAIGMPTVGLIFSNLGSVILVIAVSVVISLFTKLPNVFECILDIIRHTDNIISATAKKYDIQQ